MTPATFADFLDGLSRAMGLPVAPTVSTRRVSLPAAPAQAMLAADPDVNLDAAVAVMYEAGELHDTDTPATSTRVRGRGVGITFSERRQSEPPAGHGRVVFTERERALSGGASIRPASLAARWAAKEAVVKVLVDSRGLEWHDCEVLNGERGEPLLAMTGTVQAAAEARGIGSWLLSLSHDGDMAIAFVVATRSTS